jgi:hypothetical protein
MGIMGMLRNPAGALTIAAMFLGGPLSNAKLWAGVAAGGCGIVVAIYAVIRGFRQARSNSERHQATIAVTSIVLFSLGVAFTIALGRISPEWLHARVGDVLPSRYFTLNFLFWSSLLALVISWRLSVVDWLSLGLTSVVVGILVFGFIRVQLIGSEVWFHFYRQLDVVAGGLILSADDPALMSPLYPDQPVLDGWAQYLRREKLSMFAEPRAQWAGARFSSLGLKADLGSSAAIERQTPLANGMRRVEGHVVGARVSVWKRSDVLFVRDDGTIAGFGRTLGESDGPAGDHFIGYLPSGVSVVTYVLPAHY